MSKISSFVTRDLCPVCCLFIPDYREGTCSTKCANIVERFRKRASEAKLALQMLGFKCTWQNECQLDIILPLGMAYCFPSVSQSFQWPDPKLDIADLGSEHLQHFVDRMIGFELLSEFMAKFYVAGLHYTDIVEYRELQVKKHYHDDNFTQVCKVCHFQRLRGELSFHGDNPVCLDCLVREFSF